MIVNRHDISENEALPIPSKVRMRPEVRARMRLHRGQKRSRSLKQYVCEGIALNAIPEDTNSYTKVWKNEKFTQHISISKIISSCRGIFKTYESHVNFLKVLNFQNVNVSAFFSVFSTLRNLRSLALKIDQCKTV